MGVRLVPEIESAVLYYRSFLVMHVRMTHACPDYLSIWLQSFEALRVVSGRKPEVPPEQAVPRSPDGKLSRSLTALLDTCRKQRRREALPGRLQALRSLPQRRR